MAIDLLTAVMVVTFYNMINRVIVMTGMQWDEPVSVQYIPSERLSSMVRCGLIKNTRQCLTCLKYV